MSKITEAARGQECMIRLPGVCNGNPETTVFAHLRMAGITGVGMKAPDLFGAFACGSCHDEVDRRTRALPGPDAHNEFLEAIIRTQYYLLKKGLIKC